MSANSRVRRGVRAALLGLAAATAAAAVTITGMAPASAVAPAPNPAWNPAYAASSGDALSKVTFTLLSGALSADVSYVEFRVAGSTSTDSPLNAVLARTRVVITDAPTGHAGYFRVPALDAATYVIRLVVSGATVGLWQDFTVTGTLPTCPGGDTVTHIGSATDSLETTFACEHRMTAAGTWEVPYGVSTVDILAVGGGGGGGGATNGYAQSGGGGGGGGQANVCSNVAATGKTFTVVVGAGGTGGTSYGTAGPSRLVHLPSLVRGAAAGGDGGAGSNSTATSTATCTGYGALGGKGGGVTQSPRGAGGTSGASELGGDPYSTGGTTASGGGGGGAEILAEGGVGTSTAGGAGGTGVSLNGTDYGLFDLLSLIHI